MRLFLSRMYPGMPWLPALSSPATIHRLHRCKCRVLNGLLRAVAVLFVALFGVLFAALFTAPLSAQTPTPTRFADDMAERTRACTACHGAQGEGVNTAAGEVAYPALADNRAVLLKDPTNLVQGVLYGGYGPATRGHPRPFGMPPAVLEWDERDIAAVLTHLRTQWGNQAAEVTPLQVNRIRAASAP